MPPSRNSQSGSVMLYILIGIVLLAALYISYGRSGSGGTSSNTATQAQMKTAYLAVQDAVTRYNAGIEKITMKGYSSDSITAAYPANKTSTFGNNPNCAVSACNLFAPDGGNVQEFSFIKNYPSLSGATAVWLNDFKLVYAPWYQGGTSTPYDLIITFRVTEDFCRYYNKQLGVSSIPSFTVGFQYQLSHTPHGTNVSPTGFAGGGQASQFLNKGTGCGLNSDGYYWVLAQVYIR